MASIELFKQARLFGELTDEELKIFADTAQQVELESGATIIEEGKPGDAIYIVEEGQVVVTKTENEVKSVIVTLEKGEQFGEMSLIENAPTSASVSADGRVVLLKIPRDKFLGILEQNDKIAAKIYKALATSLSRRLRQTSADLMTWKPGFDF